VENLEPYRHSAIVLTFAVLSERIEIISYFDTIFSGLIKTRYFFHVRNNYSGTLRAISVQVHLWASPETHNQGDQMGEKPIG
jgi:hypothetical protein